MATQRAKSKPKAKPPKAAPNMKKASAKAKAAPKKAKAAPKKPNAKAKPSAKTATAKAKPTAKAAPKTAPPKTASKHAPTPSKKQNAAEAADAAATEAALAALEGPLANEYTRTASDDDAMSKVKVAAAVPESPLAVIDTATHAALVAVNPIVASPPALPRMRPPRPGSLPPATIAPRNVFLPDRVIVDVEGDTFPRTKLDEHGRDESILPPATLDAIRVKVSVAQRYLEGDARSAYDAFLAGFELIPKPFENWNAAGWLLVAMGECAMRAGDHARAFAALRDAMHCPGTIGNPWVHLRLGQVRLELGDDKATDDLSRALKGGGPTLFDGLDPKFLAAVERSKSE